MYAEALATGAIISGRRTFELAGRWNGDHHDDVPILILTHEPEQPSGNIRYFDDVRACADEARRLAGDRVTMVHGAGAAQALLEAGELDEMEIHLVPVVLGAGRSLFGTSEPGHELELVRVLEGNNATHLRYRVVGTRPA